MLQLIVASHITFLFQNQSVKLIILNNRIHAWQMLATSGRTYKPILHFLLCEFLSTFRYKITLTVNYLKQIYVLMMIMYLSGYRTTAFVAH